MILNENNIQAPFQYKIGENTFELLKINGELELNTNNIQVKVFSGERLFCADIGYSIDGAVEEMEFLVDDIKVYPQILDELKDLQTVEVKDNEIYLIRNELDFKSIIFFPLSDLNKNFKFTVTTYSSTFSAFMLDEIAIKLNSLDINYPIKNYNENINYKVNDIIKYNGYIYRVFKDFTSDSTDYYLKTNCNLLTPFKKLELDTNYKANELIEDNNNFLIVQKDFRYENKDAILTNLNGLLKPLCDIIIWFDGISKIYKNQIVIKDNISYIVLEDIENPVWNNIQNQLERLIKAENTFYDDSNSSFGSNTNTVQKAIEKLKSSKQNSLTAGNNISLNGNKITLIGGTSKEYILENNYFISDLIIKDEKIYRVNEDFISSDWTSDRSKLTLISSGGGGSNEAIDISFDNSNTNLEYLSGYNFPKFKIPIPNTINLLLADVNGTIEYTAAITNQEDGSYILNSNIENYNISSSSQSIFFIIKSIDSNINIYQIYSILSQFFNFSSMFNLESNECSISGIEDELKISIGFITESHIAIGILKQDGTNFNQGSYNITLNIKNKVLRNEDANIFACSNGFMTTQSVLDFYNFSLEQNNNLVFLNGSYTLKEGAGLTIGFYSPIIENYFNVSNISTPIFKNTTEIISSSGKPLEFAIVKTEQADQTNIQVPTYFLLLRYQDYTDIQVGDTITFNLTPDKNSELNPIYSEVANLQEAIESIKTMALNSIKPIGSVYFQIAKEDGSFDDNESPENLFGGVWELQYADEGIFLRTEGGNSNENRVSGVQGDAIRNMTGTFQYGVQSSANQTNLYSGVLYQGTNLYPVAQTTTSSLYGGGGFKASNQVPTGSEVRGINRLMRIYKRIA
ncbi:hypothetical protein [Brachyspira hampsonii]|uniref:Phage tail protein n=1 Tax=Brachyspira hampsonii TaxID=1287055 RepID=A0AAC9XK52_9SPIR|nr:hypothetical protein [Brachyspira hampsonii]ASJ21492.1 phage tail protein [Brachyspira hampsonii]ELV06135.1 VSH-1 tail protein [Brachyspira hampsonii 30599]MBW5379820.1 phage tail protein [Brachyspira hampsonii]MBW5411087.1 phage tail protein [Brachyspira hampsonii]OEJ18006.1 phage tail protein [Brachyspira hampsonii]